MLALLLVQYFNENLAYVEFLQFDLISTLIALSIHIQGRPFKWPIYFQQDGASSPNGPLFVIISMWYFPVVEHIEEGQYSGLGETIGLPHLTLLDYFSLGYLKSKVFVNKSNNIDNSQYKITVETWSITPKVVTERVYLSSWFLSSCERSSFWTLNLV